MSPISTNENRGRYDRRKLRHPSDLTDEERALAAPLIPLARRGGNKRTVVVREVVHTLLYIFSTDCQWPAISKDLPLRGTLHDYFARWDHDATLGRLHHTLCVKYWELAGRGASPSAAVIDSQSVKSAEKGAYMDPPGYDGGMKIKGRKRHVLKCPLHYRLLLNLCAKVKCAMISSTRPGSLRNPDRMGWTISLTTAAQARAPLPNPPAASP